MYLVQIIQGPFDHCAGLGRNLEEMDSPDNRTALCEELKRKNRYLWAVIQHINSEVLSVKSQGQRSVRSIAIRYDFSKHLLQIERRKGIYSCAVERRTVNGTVRSVRATDPRDS